MRSLHNKDRVGDYKESGAEEKANINNSHLVNVNGKVASVEAVTLEDVHSTAVDPLQ